MSTRPWLRRASLWLPPLAYMTVIYYMSSQPDPTPALTTLVYDKLLHLLEYAGLAALLSRALIGEGSSAPTTFFVALNLASAYGASDEYHQLFAPSRDADLQDWIVDTAGAALGAIGYLFSRASRRRHPPPRSPLGRSDPPTA